MAGRPATGFASSATDRASALYTRAPTQDSIRRGDVVTAVARSGLGLAAMGVSLAAQVSQPGVHSSEKAYKDLLDAVDQFGEVGEMGVAVTTGPWVTPEIVHGFVAACYVWGRAKGTVEAALSALLAYLRAHPELAHPTLTPAAVADVRRVTAQSAKLFPSVVRKMKPFTDAQMLAMGDQLSGFADKGSMFSMAWIAKLLLARSCCLRSVDFLAPSAQLQNMRVVDVGGFRAVEIRLAYTKSDPASYDPFKHNVVAPRDLRYGGRLDYLPALERYLAARELKLSASFDDPKLQGIAAFPRWRRTASKDPVEVPGPYSYATAYGDFKFVMGRARAAMLQAGSPDAIDPSEHAFHSLRRTGATYYATVCRLPREAIARIGIWASLDSVTDYDGGQRQAALQAMAASSRARTT